MALLAAKGFRPALCRLANRVNNERPIQERLGQRI
jgi:hypothetical protein